MLKLRDERNSNRNKSVQHQALGIYQRPIDHSKKFDTKNASLN